MLLIHANIQRAQCTELRSTFAFFIENHHNPSISVYHSTERTIAMQAGFLLVIRIQVFNKSNVKIKINFNFKRLQAQQ